MTIGSRRAALAAGVLLASCTFSCGSEQPAAPDGEVASAPQAVVAATTCQHVRGGPPSTKVPLLSLSEAHASLRYFGANGSYTEVDQALAAALTKPSSPVNPDQAVLAAYLAALGNGQSCVAPSASDCLGPANVQMHGDVAVVRPGTGQVSLPAKAKAVAIDLRGLDDAPDLRDALDRAASLALASPVARPTQSIRASYGQPDSDGDPAYFSFLESKPQAAIPAGAAHDLPLAVLTEDALAPAAAELAASLRLAHRAWIFGADAHASTAESSWSPVGQLGISWRRMDLSGATSGVRWPDVIPADVTGDPIAAVHDLATRGAPPPVTPGPSSRPAVVALDATVDDPPPDLGPGAARADLVAIHGMLRFFYPYFDIVGDRIDERLAETLAEVEHAASAGALDRASYALILGRMANAIQDGHALGYDDLAPFGPHIPLDLQQVNGDVLVRHSLVPGVLPGDRLVTIDGQPTSAWLTAAERDVSAATPGYLFTSTAKLQLLETLVYPQVTRHLGVVRADGSFHPNVAAAPAIPPPNPWNERSSGWLADLGAPDVYYLDLDYQVVTDTSAALASIGEASGAKAMIVDMRGYPFVDNQAMAQALIPTPFNTPGFWIATAESPTSFTYVDYGTPLPPTPPTYAGPIVLLVGNATVSAAENFCIMLDDAGRLLHVVGQQSAGTNGDVTGVRLPGQFTFYSTGMKLTHADGSLFDAIGIVPDVVVTPTQADLAAGHDPELLAALKSLP